jgi:hypothetical protein
MRSVKQTASSRQDVTIDVSYAGGRAKGTARTPTATNQLKSVTIDTVLTPAPSTTTPFRRCSRRSVGCRCRTVSVLSADRARSP